MDPLAIFGSMFMLFFFGFNAENFFGTDTAGLATTALINRATKSFCGSVMLFGLSYFADTVSGCHNQTIEAGGSNILDFETLDTSNGTCPWHDGSSDPFTSTILEDSATRFWYAPMQTPAPCISLDDNPMRPAGSDPMSPEQHLDPDAFSKMIDFAALVFCLLVPFIFLRWIYNRIWPSNLTQNNVGIQTLNVNPGPTDPLITGRLDEILNLVRATQTRPGGRSGPENSDTHNVGIDDRVLAAITSSNTTQVQAIDLLKEGLQKIVSQGSSGEDIEQRVDRRLQERMSVMQSSSEEIEQRVDRRLQEKMSELKSSSDEIEQRLHRRLQDRMSAMQSYSTGIEQRVDRRLQERMSELSSSEEIEQRVDRRLQERMSELQSSSDEINHRIDKIFQEKISEVQTSSEGIEHKFDRRLQERISEIQEPSEDMRRRLETLEERDKVSENEVKGISEQIRQLQDSENASIQDVRGEVEKQKQAAEARISAFFEKFEKSVIDQIKKYNEKKAGELQALVEGKLEQVRNEASKAPAPAVDEKTLKDLEKRITGVRTQMSEVSHTSKELKEWCDGLDFKIQQYDENLTIAKDIRDSVRSLTSQVGKTQEQVTALSASKGDTQRLTEQLSQRLGQLETISAMPEKVQDLNQKLEEIQQVQRQHAPAVSKLENDVQEFDKRLTSQVTKMDEKFQEKSSSQDKSLSKLRQRVSKVETKQGESEGRTQEVSKEEVEKLLKESYDKLKNELEQELKLLDFPHFASRLHNLSNRFDNIEETVTERVKQISSQEGDFQKDFKKDLEEDLKKGLRVDLEKDLREDLEKDLVEMSIRLDIVESERENHAVRLGQIDERDTQTQADIKQLISTMEGHEKSHEQKILELQWHHSRNITGFESSLRSTAEEIRGKFDTLLKAIYGNNTVATNQPLVEHLQALQRNHTALWDMLRASDQKAKMTVDSQTTEPIQQNTSTVPRSSSVPQPNSGNRPIPMTPPDQQPATITDQMNIDQQTPILAQPNVPVPQHSLVHQPTLTSPSNPVPQTTPARQTATTIDRMSINELLTSEPIQQHVPTVPRSNLNPQNNLANLLTQYQPTSSAQQAAPVQQTATTTGQMSIEEQRILTYIQPQVSGTVQSSLVSQPYPVNQFYSRQQTPAQQAAPVPRNPAPTDQMNIDQQNPVPVQSHGLTAPQYSPTFQSSISGRADISSQPPPAQQTTAVPITPTTQSTFDFASPPLPSETNVPTFRPKAKPKGRLQSRQAQNALQHEKDKVIYESAAIPNSAEIDPGLDDVEARAAAQELRAAAQESSHIQGRSSDRSGVLPLTPGYRHAADMPYNPGQLEVSQATQTSSHIQGQPLIQSRGAVPEEQQNVAPIAETSNPVTTSGQQKVTSQTTSKASPTSETSLGDSQRATKQSNVVPQHQATSHPVETSAKQQEAPQVVKQGSSQSQGVSGQQQATSNPVRELSTGEKTRETSEKSVPGQSLSESQPVPSKPKKVQWGATVSVKQKELTEQDHFARDTIHEWFGSLETKPMSSSRWAVPEESKDTPPKTEAASKPVESSGKQEKTTQAIQQPPSDSQAKPLGESRPAPSEESKDTPPKTEIASKPVETPGRQEETTQAIQPRPSNSQVKPLDESRPAPSEEKKKDTPPRTEEASKAVETSRRQDNLHSQEKSLGESQGTISKQKKDTVPWGASVSVKQKELTEEDRFITNALRDAFGSLNTRPMSASRWAVSEESEDTPPGEAAGTRPTKESSEKEKVAHDASKETSTNTPKPLLGQSRWATSEEQQVATPPRNEPGKSPAGGSGRKGMAGDNEAAKDLGQEPISAEQDDMALEDEGDPFADVVEEVVFFDEL